MGLVINSLYLFPCIQIGYVIRLHRLRIGGGEIQGAKEKKAKTRRTNEEIIICNFNYFFYRVCNTSIILRVGPK